MQTPACPPTGMELDGSRRSADTPSSDTLAPARHALLIVEDDAAFSRELAELLVMHQDFAVRAAADGSSHSLHPASASAVRVKADIH